MQCEECGRVVRSINYRHLQSCSGITPLEYRSRHPAAALMDADVRASVGRAGDANGNWRGGKTIKFCRDCQKRLAASNRSGLCSSCTKIGIRNPFAGKRHNAVTRAKMKVSNTRRDPATYRGGARAGETMSAARRKDWANRSPTQREEMIERLVAAGQRSGRLPSNTRQERVVAALLSERGIPFATQVKIGRYVVDFVVGSTVIECYGDYWHCNPESHAPGAYNRSIRMTAQERWAKNAARVRAIEARGYRVIVLWECEILSGRVVGVFDAFS
jgi:G:T-mismatch repair DNA endonuclease (very short patch repair protein)